MSISAFSLENKTILVTGASSGLGQSTAIECSKAGAKLVITGKNTDRLNNTYNIRYICTVCEHFWSTVKEI